MIPFISCIHLVRKLSSTYQWAKYFMLTCPWIQENIVGLKSSTAVLGGLLMMQFPPYLNKLLYIACNQQLPRGHRCLLGERMSSLYVESFYFIFDDDILCRIIMESYCYCLSDVLMLTSQSKMLLKDTS